MARSARVAAVVLLQLAILAGVPARQVLARARGIPVTLKTAPVDPWDAFAGHYVTLSYEVERPPSPDLLEPGLRDGDGVWLTLAAGDPAWSLVSVTRDRPAGASGRVSVRARWRIGWNGAGRAELEGARRLYVDEAQGKAIDGARRAREAGLVDLRVGEDGTPAVVGLRIAGVVLRDE